MLAIKHQIHKNMIQLQLGAVIIIAITHNFEYGHNMELFDKDISLLCVTIVQPLPSKKHVVMIYQDIQYSQVDDYHL